MNVPPGYERLLQAHAVAVARSDVIPAIRKALVGSDGTRSTLYEFAARTPGARPLRGRGTAWATALPGGPRVVVRHNRHGGALATFTGDRFLAPTRAPLELATALALLARGIRTPDVLAYVVYPPGGLLQRADVATQEVPASADLAEVLLRERSGSAGRASALRAAAALAASLAAAGAVHHDLNAKNVLIARDGAWVLDVDRISLGVAAPAALEANLRRLARSLRKWRDRQGMVLDDDEIAALERMAREAPAGH